MLRCHCDCRMLRQCSVPHEMFQHALLNVEHVAWMYRCKSCSVLSDFILNQPRVRASPRTDSSRKHQYLSIKKCRFDAIQQHTIGGRKQVAQAIESKTGEYSHVQCSAGPIRHGGAEHFDKSKTSINRGGACCSQRKDGLSYCGTAESCICKPFLGPPPMTSVWNPSFGSHSLHFQACRWQTA